MTTHTTNAAFDLKGLTSTGITAQNVRRSAEIARADYLADILKKTGPRITAFYRSAGALFSFVQRQNQAARL
jgi:hypothetical protein